jgi:chaperone required for assembly of F1-ATPase
VKKRFYKEAAVIALDGGGHGVALDGRPIRTPGGARLAAPTLALAEAIAAEWEAQDEDIRPLTMPMMRLAATAIDRIGKERAAIVDGVAAYGGSDLLCYRAEGPDRLVERQAELWQPLLDWAAEAHGARLGVTQGIGHVAQDVAALAALRGAVAALDDYRLAAVSQLTASCGSLVVALALEAGHIDAGRATAASQLDEDWQAEQWGHDKEAADRRRNVAGEIADAARFLELLAG